MATKVVRLCSDYLLRHQAAVHRRYLFCNFCRRSSQIVEKSIEKEVHEDEYMKVRRFKSPPLIPHELLVSYMLKKSDASIDPGSIYDTYPNAHPTLKGRAKEKQIRSVWREQDCTKNFPPTPEEANLDLVHYMEQRDIWQRRQVIDVPDFCAGSIIAVTRADRFAPEGWTRFIGLCIFKNNAENSKFSAFTLRNVIQGEPLEIQYPTYHPLIQKIEVLRHERWENEDKYTGLKFLRDYPVDYSLVDESMPPEEYTFEPKVRRWTPDDELKCKLWFEAIYEARRRR